MHDLRLFFALPVSPRIGTVLSRQIEQFRAAGAEVKWVKPQNLHLTLKFLGATTQERVAGLVKAARRTAAKMEAFELLWDGFGAFPSIKRARVIWAGVTKGEEELKKLARAIEKDLTCENVPEESREFTPHLTLGRLRSTAGMEKLLIMLEAMQHNMIGTMRVSHFSLIKSTLTPGGPVYEELTLFPLGEKYDG
jgi:RNA 2',3'-cyclic 3'-phosphodiesterase